MTNLNIIPQIHFRLENQCNYGQGNGLIDVEATFNHLSTYANSKERDVRYIVSFVIALIDWLIELIKHNFGLIILDLINNSQPYLVKS